MPVSPVWPSAPSTRSPAASGRGSSSLGRSPSGTRVLLLDEPTNHLDLAAQLAMVRLLREVADSGVAVLVALHDLAQAAALCDDLVVLRSGETAAVGPPHEVLSPTLLASVWGVRGEWVRGEHGRALVVSPL